MDFSQATLVASRIGWQSPAPVPDGYRLNHFLEAGRGRLRAYGLDLAAFFKTGPSPGA